MASQPLIAFADTGKAPVLSYNVPEPVSYFGTNIVEIDTPKDYFKFPSAMPPVKDPDKITLDQVVSAMRAAFKNDTLFPQLGAELRFWETTATEVLQVIPDEFPCPPGTTFITPADINVSDSVIHGVTFHQFPMSLRDVVSDSLRLLKPETILANLRKGLRMHCKFNKENKLDVEFIDPGNSKPRLSIVETYRLTSYLGDYGAGRVLSTFSLLPGEKTRIAVQSYTKTTSKRNEATSILDSHSDEAADNFERAVKSEQSDKQEEQRRDEWHVEAQAQANWGFASAKLSAGYAGSASAGREQFSKNVANATSKTSSRASNKRDIQIEQRSQAQIDFGTTESSEREIQNINTGHTLNFVFRQMNQEFITILHFIDARVGFFDAAIDGSLRLIEISELDRFLATQIVDGPTDKDQYRKEIFTAVETILENVLDYQGTRVSLIEEATIGVGPNKYLRVRRDLTTKYDDRILVPGILMSATTNVLRTDGVIVEALLGAGDGLDSYAKDLQTEQARAKDLANQVLAAEASREELAKKILEAADGNSAELFSQAFNQSSLAKIGGAP